jgi:hypothetical protein
VQERRRLGVGYNTLGRNLNLLSQLGRWLDVGEMRRTWLWLEALCEIEMEGRLMVEKDGEMDWGRVVGEVVGILEDELGERDKGDKDGEGVWEEALDRN